MREGESLAYLRNRLAHLRADLYQMCGQMPVTALEILCRKINQTAYKIYSFKGGKKTWEAEKEISL